jgi:hypothetical protein
MERRTRESRPISRRRATRACYPYFQLSIRAPLHRTRPLATWASSLQSCKAPRILPLSRAVWPLARPNTLPTRPLCPSTTAVSKGFARRPCESHSPRRKLGGLRAWWAADIECNPRSSCSSRGSQRLFVVVVVCSFGRVLGLPY